MALTTTSIESLETLDTPLLAVPVFGTNRADARDTEGPGEPQLPDALPASLAATLKRARADLDATTGTKTLVWSDGPEGPLRIVFIGVGKREADLTAEDVRRFAGTAVRQAEQIRIDALGVLVPSLSEGPEVSAQSAAEGAVLASWRFRELKTGAGETEAPTEVKDVTLVGDGEAFERGAENGVVIADAENVARVLQSRPGNVATPSHLARVSEALGRDVGFEVDILGPDRLKEERMRALLAVSQGSEQEPRLIVMKYNGGDEGEKPLVLVGKGLTFDAGGISLKPPKGMEEMRFDMSGGAAVIAAMSAVARLGVKRNVIGIVPSSENLLGGRAVKPGDVVRTRSGKTVEILNTDAEGRLILCDSLDYALQFEPEAMIDCATLTGAVVIGLGHHAIGLMGTDDDLVEEVRKAGERSGERCWALPMWPEYRKQLDSEQADLQNIGGRPAGSITAGWFLREFVKDTKWAHLDVAGTAYGDGERASYLRKGGYGVPTRLLVEWVRSRA
ncbi:MAG TPA: leucyl aminopeptidase [Longimicrobiales bacterium]|nr:leucyl aminopeptidase [Longimicrobiales bacterium]